MILTGKCKEGYLNWRKDKGYELTFYQNENQGNSQSFDEVYAVYENALIIEYFSTLKYKGQDFWLYVFDAYYKIKIESMTINDVNIQAIEKANEILNKEL